MKISRDRRRGLNWSHYADRLRVVNRSRLWEGVDEDRHYDLWMRLAIGNGRSQVWKFHDWRIDHRAALRAARKSR